MRAVLRREEILRRVSRNTRGPTRGRSQMADADLIALVGSLPANCHSGLTEDLGVYKKQSERVNGRHTYVKVDDLSCRHHDCFNHRGEYSTSTAVTQE